MSSALTTLQETTVDTIESTTFFANVPVLHERMQNVQNLIAQAVNKLKGIAILVMTPVGTNRTVGAPDVNLDVDLTCQVAEYVTLNNSSSGTQLPAALVAEQLAAHLHNTLWMTGKTLVFRRLQLVPNKALIVYNVIFATNVKLTPSDS